MFDFRTIYSKMDVSSKQRLLKVIFPEKMSYDSEKCRTGKLNEFLALILMTSKELTKGKVGQFFPKLALTHWVEPQPHLSNQAKQDLRKLIEVLEVDNGDIYMDK